MLGVSREKLISAAAELNDVLGLNPQIDTTEEDTLFLIACIKEAATLIDWENDQISDATKVTLEELGISVPKPEMLDKIEPPNLLLSIGGRPKRHKDEKRPPKLSRGKKKRAAWIWRSLSRIEAAAMVAERMNFKFESLYEFAKMADRLYIEYGGESNMRLALKAAVDFIKAARGLSFLRYRIHIKDFKKTEGDDEKS